MASLLQMAGLLVGIDNLNDPEVKRFADKITSYCEGNGKKAERMDKLLGIFAEEVMPFREQMGEEGFREVVEVTRAKIAEIGGVTGFLPNIEGSEGQKKS
jgi:hypothetical protein